MMPPLPLLCLDADPGIKHFIPKGAVYTESSVLYIYFEALRQLTYIGPLFIDVLLDNAHGSNVIDNIDITDATVRANLHWGDTIRHIVTCANADTPA